MVFFIYVYIIKVLQNVTSPWHNLHEWLNELREEKLFHFSISLTLLVSSHSSSVFLYLSTFHYSIFTFVLFRLSYAFIFFLTWPLLLIDTYLHTRRRQNQIKCEKIAEGDKLSTRHIFCIHWKCFSGQTLMKYEIKLRATFNFSLSLLLSSVAFVSKFLSTVHLRIAHILYIHMYPR